MKYLQFVKYLERHISRTYLTALSRLPPAQISSAKHFLQIDLRTLESGIDVGQGINVGPGKFAKKNKRRALNKRRASEF